MENKTLHRSHKIVSRKVLAGIVRELKCQGKIIVTTNGSFDLLHIGHVTMLQEAESLGDVLIVGLNSDTSIQRYKGKYRPICPEAHRVGMLAALSCTDYITIFDELTPIELLKVIQPHIHVNSPEHGKECVEREVVEQHGGRIHLAQLVKGMSTSQLIKRIVGASSHTPCRGVFINIEDLAGPENLSGTSKFALPSETRLHSLREFASRGFRLFILTHFSKNPHPEEARPAGQNEHLREILHQQGVETYWIIFPPSLSNEPRSKQTFFEQAVGDFDVVLARSFLISRDMADIQLGRDLNCKTILLKDDPHNKEDLLGAAGPHFIVKDFQDIMTLLGE